MSSKQAAAAKERERRADQSVADKAGERGEGDVEWESGEGAPSKSTELRRWPISDASKTILELSAELFAQAQLKQRQSLAAAAKASDIPSGVSANLVDDEWVEILQGKPEAGKPAK